MEPKMKQTCAGMTEWSNQGQSSLRGNAAKDAQDSPHSPMGLPHGLFWTVFCIGGDWVDAEAAVQTSLSIARRYALEPDSTGAGASFASALCEKRSTRSTFHRSVLLERYERS